MINHCDRRTTLLSDTDTVMMTARGFSCIPFLKRNGDRAVVNVKSYFLQ